MRSKNRIHPAVLDAASDLRHGKMTRRGFLRFATLLGASVPAAYALAGCAPRGWDGPWKRLPVKPCPRRRRWPPATLKRGGTFTCAMAATVDRSPRPPLLGRRREHRAPGG